MFDKLFKRHSSTASGVALDFTSTSRWVVLDTETTGLSLWRDRVISIAAVAIQLDPDLRSARIDLGDTFEAVIRQDHLKANKDNILIHHIGVGAQSHGHSQEQVLAWFAQWIGQSPLFAYHAPFDRAMLTNAYKKSSLAVPANPWVDIQPLANWVTRDTHMLGLDECMALFDLNCIVRHQAASDTFLTAELLLKIMPRLREVASSFEQVQRLSLQNVIRT